MLDRKTKIAIELSIAIAFFFAGTGKIFAATSAWSDVSGSGGKNGLVSDRKAGETNIAVSSDENIFAAYQYRNKRAQVKKFNGEKWVELSDAVNPKGLISVKKGGNPTLAVKGGEVFAAFTDYANNAKARVKKWNGSAWSDLSDETHSLGLISAMKGFEPELCFDKAEKNLYAAFRDEASGERIKVMKWSENLGWSDVADASNPGGLISGGVASETDIKASKNNDDIFVAFEDIGNGGLIRVKKWDGSAWQYLSDESHPDGFASAIAGYSPSIDTDAAGNLFLVYTGKKAKNTYIQKWNGSLWENIGDGIAIRGKTLESTIAIDERGYLYLAYSQKTRSGWRVRAKILHGSAWLDAKDGKSENISKRRGKGDPALAICGSRLYMSFSDARNKNKARVKMLNFEL